MPSKKRKKMKSGGKKENIYIYDTKSFFRLQEKKVINVAF